MRPMKVQWLVAVYMLAGVAVSMACLDAGAWLAGRYFPDVPAAAAIGAVLGLIIPVVLSLRLSRRLAGTFDALAASALPLTRGVAVSDAALPVAEAHAAHAALVQASAAVRKRESALRGADRAKDAFLATLGHELRNPLSAQIAAAHVLAKFATAPEAQQAASVISRQVQQMNRLVEDLLDVTRVTQGKASLNRGPLNLARAVETAVQELRAAGRLEQHAVELELGDVWVHADEARIVQIVCNLVGNAVKYTPAGGKISVSLRRDGDNAVLRVRDDGEGMSLELASRVFDLFVQGEDDARAGGLGIGLTLVRHLVELHGGKAYAASSGPGQGSVFTVTLPAIEAQAPAGVAALTTAPHSRHRILLVEDNPDTRNTMFDALQLDGHRVFEAADAAAGLRTLTAVKPDVAVIDIGLPGMDGYELAHAMQDCPERRRMVLIAMTGLEQPDALRRAREAGFDDYVTKPIAPDDLVRLIDAAFAAKKRRGPEK